MVGAHLAYIAANFVWRGASTSLVEKALIAATCTDDSNCI